MYQLEIDISSKFPHINQPPCNLVFSSSFLFLSLLLPFGVMRAVVSEQFTHNPKKKGETGSTEKSGKTPANIFARGEERERTDGHIAPGRRSMDADQSSLQNACIDGERLSMLHPTPSFYVL